MENLARLDENRPVFQDTGTVLEQKENSFLVAARDYRVWAQKAAGCLLLPEPGDTILFVSSTDGTCYILSVLAKEQAGQQRIQFSGDTDLICKDGELSLSGQKGVHVASPKQVQLTTSNLKVVAAEGECTISRLTFLSNFFLGRLANIKMVAGKVESICERLQQKITRSYRTVEDMDHLRAGKVDYRAERQLSLRGKYTLMTAKEDVKIDGERIHMG